MHIYADRLQSLVLNQSGSAAKWGSAARVAADGYVVT